MLHRSYLFHVCLLGAALLLMPIMSDARQLDRKIILLSCPTDIPEPRKFCQAMAGALAEAVPSTVIRNVPRGEETPTRAGDAGVALVVVDQSSSGMTGRLDWQVGREPPRSGPEMQLSVMDTTLSSNMYDRFARSLVKATEEMLSALVAR